MSNLQRIFYRSFPPSFGSFSQAVSGGSFKCEKLTDDRLQAKTKAHLAKELKIWDKRVEWSIFSQKKENGQYPCIFLQEILQYDKIHILINFQIKWCHPFKPSLFKKLTFFFTSVGILVNILLIKIELKYRYKIKQYCSRY